MLITTVSSHCLSVRPYEASWSKTPVYSFLLFRELGAKDKVIHQEPWSDLAGKHMEMQSFERLIQGMKGK
jgi:hypothetical protein